MKKKFTTSASLLLFPILCWLRRPSRNFLLIALQSRFPSSLDRQHSRVSSGVSHAGGVVRLALIVLVLCLLVPRPSRAEYLRWLSAGMRARVSETTVLGSDQPESFRAYDAVVNIGLPWERYSQSGWGAGTRLMASAGILRGGGDTALVVSLIPMLAFGSQDGRFILDMGAGGALLSRNRFGTQDFGGPFQFALTLGAGFPLYERLGLGYRFLHYSDAGINGSGTVGADLHMIELTYRLLD